PQPDSRAALRGIPRSPARPAPSSVVVGRGSRLAGSDQESPIALGSLIRNSALLRLAAGPARQVRSRRGIESPMKKAQDICGIGLRGALAVILAAAFCNAAEPFYEGLGDHQRIVTTASPEAQKYFDQGLRFLQG